MKRIRKHQKKGERRGVAAVEMAVCLPVLFLIFFGSIDLIRYNLLRNIVAHATYEAARTGIVEGATIEEVSATVAAELAPFGKDLDYELAMTPNSLPDDDDDEMTITLTCDIRKGGWFVSGFITGDTIEETMTVLMENR